MKYLKPVLIVALMLVLAACGDQEANDPVSTETEQENQEPEVKEEPEEVEEIDGTEEASRDDEEVSTVVELTLNAEMNDDDVIDFQGETNLPDGTLIAYEVWHEEDFEQFADGEIEVENGIYKEGVSVGDWPDGEIIVWVAFQTVLGTSVHQPDEIIEVFGEMGENIEGDNVSESDVMSRVELEETLVKNTVVESEEAANTDQEETEETLSQQNAVSMAEDYLAYTSFSESGLIEQLEFEGFSNEDATYAVDQIDVDWQEQAVIMAQDYLDYTNFSRTGLIEQLEFEGFSTEHATHAVDEVGF